MFAVIHGSTYAQLNNIWETIVGEPVSGGNNSGNWEQGNFIAPFRCGLSYWGGTYSGHSDYSVDFNRGSYDDDLGDPVRASAPGRVEIVNPGNGEVYLSHPGGYGSLYAHMRKIYVQEGDRVTQGQQIGEIGNVGNSSGPHLHVNQYKNGQRIRVSYNNVPYPLSVPEGQGVSGRIGPTVKGSCP